MPKKLFKPGQSGNPGGRPKNSANYHEIKRLTREQIEGIGSLILNGNIQGLQKIAENPNSSVLQVWISAGAIRAIKRGDLHSMNALLDRIIGRMPAAIEVSGPDKKPFEIEVRRQALIELGKNSEVMKVIEDVIQNQDENE